MGYDDDDFELAAASCFDAARLRTPGWTLRAATSPLSILAVLLDVDEQADGFGGALSYLADPDIPVPASVMIGYPGIDEVVVGGRRRAGFGVR
ncbi:hypothetical protein [Streptomyces niveus]|uniref:hypothetical protein n=1 Tax=Streptomyces niveus TaxID=193462 RepID=UPI003F540A51